MPDVCRASTQRTLEIGVESDARGRAGPAAVAEHQMHASPRVGIRNFDVIGVPWSNFKPVAWTNGMMAISRLRDVLDLVGVGGGVDVAVVMLRGRRGGGGVKRPAWALVLEVEVEG
jgi:hypothetical protein